MNPIPDPNIELVMSVETLLEFKCHTAVRYQTDKVFDRVSPFYL